MKYNLFDINRIFVNIITQYLLGSSIFFVNPVQVSRKSTMVRNTTLNTQQTQKTQYRGHTILVIEFRG